MISSLQKKWLNITWRAVAAGEREAMKAFDIAKVPKLSFKAHHEIVTRADLNTNDAMKRVLTRLTPHIPILSEEGGTIDIEEGLRADLAWVIDPIDGTTNYAARLPLWGISLGLIRDGEPILGAISLPAMKQRYHAVLGNGSWMGSTRLQVAKTKKIEETVGFLCYGYDTNDRRVGQKEDLALSRASRSTRRLGAATLEAAWVASGRVDYAMMHGIKPWDVAAGSLIIREAGGDMLTPTGKVWRLGQPDVLCSAPGVSRAVINCLR